jgi:heat shock protein HslJ
VRIEEADMTDDELRGPTWTLVAFRRGADEVPAAGGSEATVSFGDDGALSGSTGCNRFFGRWATDGRTLSTQVTGMTQMACLDDAVTAQEQAVLAALGAVTGWSVTDRQLVLGAGDGRPLLTYRAVDASDLAGSTWTAVGVNNGRQAVVSSERTGALSLEFGSDGRVSGSSGCNRFTGPYRLDDTDAITIGPLAGTGRRCPDPEVMALEQEYLAALQAATQLEVSAQHLTLRDAGGATQATFRRAPTSAGGS